MRRLLAEEVFDIAARALNAGTPYEIEQILTGESFLPDERTRWWERLRKGSYDLIGALKRNEPKARDWMRRLAKHTNEADRLLAMPLWKLSEPGVASVNVMWTWRSAVENMGVVIPKFPDRSESSACRYKESLLSLLRNYQTTMAGINTALFCLRLAQAQGNLGCYILTYEKIVADKWPWSTNLFLGKLLLFYAEWFSTLQIHCLREDDLIDVEQDLNAYGLSVNFVEYRRLNDPRYELISAIFGSTRDDEKTSVLLKVLPSNRTT
ncbi:MAG TPA: hypothetical protein VE092_01275 [Herbaspirillum sp.]|uniref:hypothetical protein n=1 Tax=Herbaspirillum sp. TaxID=1890675 RepID=UPI002D5EC03A|nr:hypothetical protein [Herbaspirillum sp.]HZG18618.1 hypothetical protein [Herbaspirillum sp.]